MKCVKCKEEIDNTAYRMIAILYCNAISSDEKGWISREGINYLDRIMSNVEQKMREDGKPMYADFCKECADEFNEQFNNWTLVDGTPIVVDQEDKQK